MEGMYMSVKMIQSAGYGQRPKRPKLSREMQNLVDAIIIQATADYIFALKKLEKNSDDTAAQTLKFDALRFFFSEWFRQLTDLSPRYLLEQIHKERG